MNIKFILNRYKYVIIWITIVFIIFIFDGNFGKRVITNTESSIIQMLQVLPPIMILLGLMDVWIPRESMMKYMGEDSGIIGITLSVLIAAFAAGPMYAAFPFTAVLLNKGVKFSNIMIFLNSWCVIKISTLLFEVGGLGYKFTFVRLLIDLPGVIIMGYIISYIVNNKKWYKFRQKQS